MDDIKRIIEAVARLETKVDNDSAVIREIREDVKRINGDVRSQGDWRKGHQKLHENQMALILTLSKIAIPYIIGTLIILLALVFVHTGELSRFLGVIP